MGLDADDMARLFGVDDDGPAPDDAKVLHTNAKAARTSNHRLLAVGRIAAMPQRRYELIQDVMPRTLK